MERTLIFKDKRYLNGQKQFNKFNSIRLSKLSSNYAKMKQLVFARFPEEFHDNMYKNNTNHQCQIE